MNQTLEGILNQDSNLISGEIQNLDLVQGGQSSRCDGLETVVGEDQGLHWYVTLEISAMAQPKVFKINLQS